MKSGLRFLLTLLALSCLLVPHPARAEFYLGDLNNWTTDHVMLQDTDFGGMFHVTVSRSNSS